MVGLGTFSEITCSNFLALQVRSSVESERGGSGILCVPLIFFCIKGWARVARVCPPEACLRGGYVVGILAVGLMLMTEAGAEGSGGWLPRGGNKRNKWRKSTWAVSLGREHRGVLQAP